MRVMNLAAIVSALAVTTTEAFFFPETVPTASADARVGSTAFDRLANVELTSVATGESVLVTSQWRNDELLPFQNQRCVVEFLRHFG